MLRGCEYIYGWLDVMCVVSFCKFVLHSSNVGHKGNKVIPQLNLRVLEVLGHEVNGLVGLVLVRLHRCLLRVERLVLRLVGQSVLRETQQSRSEAD